MYKLIATTLIAVFLFSCGAKKKDLIVGKWQEIETGSTISEYKSDRTYFITFDDGKTEEGKYRIDGNTLYNTEKGTSEELSVELTTLDENNLAQTIGGAVSNKIHAYKIEFFQRGIALGWKDGILEEWVRCTLKK